MKSLRRSACEQESTTTTAVRGGARTVRSALEAFVATARTSPAHLTGVGFCGEGPRRGVSEARPRGRNSVFFYHEPCGLAYGDNSEIGRRSFVRSKPLLGGTCWSWNSALPGFGEEDEVVEHRYDFQDALRDQRTNQPVMMLIADESEYATE